VIVGLAAVAAAQDETGTALVGELLDASLAGSGERHVVALTGLARRVAADDPAAPEVWYWLARAQAEQGEVDAARTTLLDGIRTGSCPRCRELFQLLELERLAAAPGTVWEFDDPHHGVFLAGTAGALRLGDGEGRSVLEWTPDPGPDADARLVLGLREGLQSVVLELRAVRVPATVQVHAEDLAGRRSVSSATITVPADRWVTVTVDARDLVPVAPGAAPRPEYLRRLELVEWGGARPSGRAPALWLDRLEIR
jgi:hypothetical protein